MNDHPRCLNTLEAAALLGTSARTLEGLRVSGDGSAVPKFGRGVRFAHSDLDARADSRQRRAIAGNGAGGGGTGR